MLAGVIDRFDDGHLDDWKTYEGKVTLSNERLLVLRSSSSGKGHAVHKLELAGAPFQIEVKVALYSDQSYAGVVLTKAGSTLGYTVLLTNHTANQKTAGVFFSPDPNASTALADKNPPVAKLMTPLKGQTYTLGLTYATGGAFELFLDGVSVGKVTDTKLTSFDQLQVWGGQDTAADHGAYFDDVVICQPAAVPTLTPDPKNPLWTGGTDPRTVLKEPSGFKLYHADNNDIHLDTSVDGTTWVTGPQKVLSIQHTQKKYNRSVWVLKEATEYVAWVAATSEGCIEFTDLYRATSADGVTWTAKGVSLPHGALGSYDSRNVYSPNVIHDGSTYHMYYDTMATSGGDQCTSGPHKWHLGVGYASSTDGMVWTKHGIVIPRGLAGELDSASVGSAHVRKSTAGFEMFYLGNDGKDSTVGFATSPDGMSWTKRGPVSLTVTQLVSIIETASGYDLYYACGKGLCRASRN